MIRNTAEAKTLFNLLKREFPLVDVDDSDAAEVIDNFNLELDENGRIVA